MKPSFCIVFAAVATSILPFRSCAFRFGLQISMFVFRDLPRC